MPKLVEVNISRSIGGGVSIVNYGNLKSDFHISESEKWDVSDLSEEEVDAFREERSKVLTERLEAKAQVEYEWRIEWRDKESDNARWK